MLQQKQIDSTTSPQGGSSRQESGRSVLKESSKYAANRTERRASPQTKAQISATMRAFAETAPPIKNNGDDDDEDEDLEEFDPEKSNNNKGGSSFVDKKTINNKSQHRSNNKSADDEEHTNATTDDTMDDLSNDEELSSDGGGSADDGSNLTGSSSSSNTRKKLRSSLPCGLTMTIVMSIIILVPITFLIVYTSIPLQSAVASLAFLDNHRVLMENSVVCGTLLIEERAISSRVMINRNAAENFANASTGNLAGYFIVDHTLTFQGVSQEMAKTRRTVDDCLVGFLREARGSDSASQALTLKDAQTLVAGLQALRQSIDDGTISGPDARSSYRQIIDEANHITLTVAHDARADVMGAELITFILSLRIGNAQGMLRDASIAIVTNDRDYRKGLITAEDLDKRTSENLKDIFANYVGTRRDFLTLEKAAVSGEMEDVKVWFNTESHDLFIGQVNALTDQSGNVTLINSASSLRKEFGGKLLTVETLIDDSKEMFRLLGVTANAQRRRILEGEKLISARTAEILKMVFAILACVVTAAAAIWLNRKEQARMEAALNSSERLSKAVQRFVPKNQLRTMGARSITQVQQNLCVEVAQAILHASLHDFAALSEQMKNMELFDWLQRYVARMSDATTQEKGYVNQVFADSVSCVFNFPTNAVNASIEMTVSSEELNLELVSEKGSNLVSMGIGIHFSVVVVGVQGSETRLSCTTVASDIGLAPRLESMTSKFGAKIIISDAVAYQLNNENYNMRYLGVTRQNGSSITVEMFEVYQADDLDMKLFKKVHSEEFEDAVRTFEELIFEKDYRESQRKAVELQLQSLHAQKKMYQDRDDDDRAREVQEEMNKVERKMRAESRQQQKLKGKRNHNGTVSTAEQQELADTTAVKHAVETFNKLKLLARKDYLVDGGAEYFLRRYQTRELERKTVKIENRKSETTHAALASAASNQTAVQAFFSSNAVNSNSSDHSKKQAANNSYNGLRDFLESAKTVAAKQHNGKSKNTKRKPSINFGGQLHSLGSIGGAGDDSTIHINPASHSTIDEEEDKIKSPLYFRRENSKYINRKGQELVKEVSKAEKELEILRLQKLLQEQQQQQQQKQPSFAIALASLTPVRGSMQTTLKDGDVIGAVAVNRHTPREFRGAARNSVDDTKEDVRSRTEGGDVDDDDDEEEEEEAEDRGNNHKLNIFIRDERAKKTSPSVSPPPYPQGVKLLQKNVTDFVHTGGSSTDAKLPRRSRDSRGDHNKLLSQKPSAQAMTAAFQANDSKNMKHFYRKEILPGRVQVEQSDEEDHDNHGEEVVEEDADKEERRLRLHRLNNL